MNSAVTRARVLYRVHGVMGTSINSAVIDPSLSQRRGVVRFYFLLAITLQSCCYLKCKEATPFYCDLERVERACAEPREEASRDAATHIKKEYKKGITTK